MSKFFKLSILVTVLALAFAFAINPTPAQASDDFNLYVKHNINGQSLGLEKALPVDVYVNGSYAFTFSFGESVSTSLPADTYFIEVKLAGTDATVMSLGPTDIPAGVDVTIKAKLSAGKSPILKVNVK